MMMRSKSYNVSANNRTSTVNDSKTDHCLINAKLCRLVEQYPCMYDRSHLHYLKKDIVEQAWIDIAKQMNDSISSCKERWRNVRTSYARSININKVPASANRTKPYYLHEELKFLSLHITPGIPIGRRSNNSQITVNSNSNASNTLITNDELGDYKSKINIEKKYRKRRGLPIQNQSLTKKTLKFELNREEGMSDNNSEGIESSSSGLQMKSPQNVQIIEDSGNQDDFAVADDEDTMDIEMNGKRESKKQQSMENSSFRSSSSLEHNNSNMGGNFDCEQPCIGFDGNISSDSTMPNQDISVHKFLTTEIKEDRSTESRLNNHIQMRSPSYVKVDYDVLFLKGILPELRAMNHRQKIRFKCEVYKIVQDIISESAVSTPYTGSSNRRFKRTRYPHISSHYRRKAKENSFLNRENISKDIQTNNDTNVQSQSNMTMNSTKEKPHNDTNDSFDD